MWVKVGALKHTQDGRMTLRVSGLGAYFQQLTLCISDLNTFVSVAFLLPDRGSAIEINETRTEFLSSLVQSHHQNKTNMNGTTTQGNAEDVTMSESGEPELYYSPAVIQDLNRRLDGTNTVLLAALDKLTPMKVRLYFPQNLRFYPEVYQMWRQWLLDARELHLRAHEALLPVREFLVQTCDTYGGEQAWLGLNTKEKALTIMMQWLDKDVVELGDLLTKYALGSVAGSSEME
ncbi:hypothetical protein EV426DRAFT_577151 [Tirmania nivea]|nr:hypothetical protein EV426DRAFT_577151 [Tirmania nivea]